MKIDFTNTRIFIRPGVTNMHKSFEGLTELIKNTMKLNQYDKDCVFLFCNSTRNIIKAICGAETDSGLLQNDLKENAGRGLRHKRRQWKSRTKILSCF